MPTCVFDGIKIKWSNRCIEGFSVYVYNGIFYYRFFAISKCKSSKLDLNRQCYMATFIFLKEIY